MRQLVKCYTCGAPVATMDAPEFDAASSFMLKKTLGALATMAGGTAPAVEALLKPDTVATAFKVQCEGCDPDTFTGEGA